MSTAGAVIIGNELLSGKVGDTNTPLLISVLREAGVTLARVVVIPDEREIIGQEVRASAGRYDYVFTSGGVGPTHDDLTMLAIAESFGVPLVRHPLLEQKVRDYFKARTNEASLKLAEVPQGARLVTGDTLPWPAIAFNNIYILPGIPSIFQEKLQLIRAELRGQRPALRSLYLSVDENTVAASLNQVVARFPDLQLGSYPRIGDPDHMVRITVEGPDPRRVEQAIQALQELIPAAHVLRVEG